MKITAANHKIILRYKKADIEERLKVGSLFIANVENKPEWTTETCYIESSFDGTYRKGDKAAVSYRIGHDYDQENPFSKSFRNENFIQKEENGDELRWCDDNEWDMFGIMRDGEIVPRETLIYCEVPVMKEDRIGSIIIPEIARKVDTDKKGFWTKVLYINPNDAKKLDVKAGDEIYCSKNSDVKKCIFGQTIIAVPVKMALSKKDTTKPLNIALLPCYGFYED